MSNLPEDLVEEILSRVPATSLKRFRSTCKGWNALFKDPRFIEKHLRKAARQSMILMLKEFRVCSMSVNLNVAPPSVEIKGAFGLKEEQVDIYQVSHCDGLLLCTTGEDKRAVVCNPCLGETKWIHLKTGNKRPTRFALGYQNNKSCRTYKVLRYWNNFKSVENPAVECEIYELSSNTWRVLDDINPKCFVLNHAGVSLKGNSYFLAQDFGTNRFLLCFDFIIERFRRMSLPPPSSLYRTCLALSVVREERLSLLHQSFDRYEMEIWVTNKFDSEDALLWSKSFTLYIPYEVFSGLLVDEEKKVALCYSLSRNKLYTIGEDNEYYTAIPFLESAYTSWSPLVFFNYVPSLVQIQQGRGKRKRN